MPSQTDRFRMREIEAVLAAELQAAQVTQRLANARVADIAAHIPSGIPAPDSNLRITQAGDASVRAYCALAVALQRWSDFVLQGLVPADLEIRNGGAPHPVPL